MKDKHEMDENQDHIISHLKEENHEKEVMIIMNKYHDFHHDYCHDENHDSVKSMSYVIYYFRISRKKKG